MLLSTQGVILLIAVGIVIYLFKSKSQLLYGVSEIVIAVLSNLVLITRMDVSSSGHITLSGSDAISIVVFTYLLSRGIGNVVDGAAVYREGVETWIRETGALPPTIVVDH